MALNEDTRNLIRYVANNDLESAKNIIRKIISKETAEKNQYFCKIIKIRLDSEPKEIKLPGEIQSLLKMEDVSNFNENRYFLSDREKDIFDHIYMTKNTNKQLSEMGLKHLNSTLLYGESGTGKTTFGKYVAYKLGLPFAYINFAYLIDCKLGETSKNINKVFDYVSKQKCVLLLDEIDAIGIERGKEDSTGEMSRVVISLMQNFDLLNNEIIIIGATNRIDMIDKALSRRFTTKHEVKELTTHETAFLVQQILQDLKIEYDLENIKAYTEKHNKQSEIINDITKSVIRMINNKEKFIL